MAESNSTVEFRTVPCFSGYRVGSDGSIWSCYRKVHQSGFGRGVRYVRGTEWKQVKPYKQSNGYCHITLYADGCQRKMLVHRLVLIAFRGDPPAGMECCHLNGNPSDNRIDNLRWDTKKGNQSDRYRHGTMPIGEKAYNSKLTNEQAKQIILRSIAGAGRKELAIEFGVDRGTVGKIARGKAYKEAWEQLYGDRAASIYQRCVRTARGRFAKVDIR